MASWSENFESTGVGGVPSDITVISGTYAVSNAIAHSGSNSFERNADGDFVSISSGVGANARADVWGIFTGAEAFNGIAVGVRAQSGGQQYQCYLKAGSGDNYNGVALYYRVSMPSGTTTQIGSTVNTTIDSSGSIWYRIVVIANGTTISVELQRSSDSKWLASDGSWGSTEVACISGTDSNISAAGEVYVSTYQFTSINGVFIDDMSYADLSSGTNRTLTAGSGSYAMTGENIGLSHVRTLAAGLGGFVLTGKALGLSTHRTLAAGSASYTLTGESITIMRRRTLSAGSGSFALTGQALVLTKTLHLSAGSGSYTLTGESITLTHITPTAATATRGDALRVQLSGADIPMMRISPAGPIAGVAILAASPRNGIGAGTLTKTSAGLAWQAPGSASAGNSQQVPADGIYLLEDGADKSKWLRVMTFASYLPAAAAASVFIADSYNAMGPADVAASDAAAGLVTATEYQLKNISPTPATGILMWLDNSASGFSTLTISSDGTNYYNPTSSTDTHVLVLGTAAPGASVNFWVKRTVAAAAASNPDILNELQWQWNSFT